MTPEDRLRDAYRDLSDRATRDIGLQRDPSLRPASSWTERPNLRFGAGLAVAGLALVAAGGAIVLALSGDGDQQVSTDDTTVTSTDAVDDDDATDDPTDGTGDSADDGDGTGTGTGTGDSTGTGTGADDRGSQGDPFDVEANRYRVATSAVRADTSDPFLNVRVDPDAGAELLAKLPATYTGLRATGQTATAEDGGVWLEVELIDPVPVTKVVRATGRPQRGWVNTTFVEPLPEGLPVTTGDVPPCGGGFDTLDTGSGMADGYLYAMESGLVDTDCLRVVLTFAGGQNPFEWSGVPEGTGPASGLPRVLTASSGGTTSSLDLGVVDSAWPGATETADHVYAVRAADGSIDLVAARPVDRVTVTGLPDRGIAVIDLELGDGSRPPAGAGVVLTAPIQASGGTVDAVGLARPFEANLGVTIVDADGDPVDAVFSGSDFLGTVRTDEYAVGTSDWTEAWGMFAVRAEGLASGRYTLVLDGQGGVSDPETLRVPFTIDRAGDEPVLTSATEQAAARALLDFASGADIDRLPLADEVTLALGPATLRTESAANLADRDAWAFDPADGFAGYTGPFSAIDVLQRREPRITAGPVPHCAGPARDWPSAFDGLDQVNIEPVGIDSCIEWYGVHLFLNDDGEIEAVALDLFGP